MASRCDTLVQQTAKGCRRKLTSGSSGTRASNVPSQEMTRWCDTTAASQEAESPTVPLLRAWASCSQCQTLAESSRSRRQLAAHETELSTTSPTRPRHAASHSLGRYTREEGQLMPPTARRRPASALLRERLRTGHAIGHVPRVSFVKSVLCETIHSAGTGSVVERNVGRMQSGRASRVANCWYAPVAASLGHSQACPQNESLPLRCGSSQG